MLKNWYILLALIFSSAVMAQPNKHELKKMSIEEYINTYAPVAVEEMIRSGVPASITISQGILESNYGNSELATKANNHFGIKCHSGWTGKGFYLDDDAKNECFRVYKNSRESFHDHSEFLRTRQRYAFLFELDIKDYKSWAKGLQRAGYATNPQYANLLIRIIEERGLSDYDKHKTNHIMNEVENVDDLVNKMPAKIYVFNNVKTVIVHPNQTLQDIAKVYQMNVRQLTKYNNLEADAELRTGSKIYLQPKRKKGFEKFHEVKEGETMWFISQKQAIKLKTLYKKNGMVEGEEPAAGERLCLWKKCKDRPKIRTNDELKKQIEKEVEAHQEEVRQQYKDSMGVKLNEPTITDTKDPVLEKPVYHTVQAKETLYAISKMYGAKVEDIDKWNNLNGGGLRIGMQLIVGYGNVKAIDPTKQPELEMINDPTPPEQEFVPTPTPEIEEILEPTPEPAVEETPEPIVEEVPELTPEPIIEEQPFDTVVPPVDVPQVDPDPEVSPAPAVDTVVALDDEPAPTEIDPKHTVAAGDHGSAKTHTVEPGQTLYAISKLYAVSVANIKEWNKLTDNALNVGQVLTIGYGTDLKQKNVEAEDIANEMPVDEPVNELAYPEYHIVEAKETLYGVAKKYGVSIEQIREWNQLESDALTTGQKLRVYNDKANTADKVPLEKEILANDKENAPVYHTVVAGDTYYSISKKYSVTVEDLKKWNPSNMNSLEIGDKVVVANIEKEPAPAQEEKPIYHVVKQGDTMYKLSIEYKVTIENIKELNNMSSNELSLGQKLIVGFE